MKRAKKGQPVVPDHPSSRKFQSGERAKPGVLRIEEGEIILFDVLNHDQVRRLG